MLIDYHVHAVAHGEYLYKQEWINEFLDQAYERGIQEIGFSEHDEYKDMLDFNLLKKVQISRHNNIDVKIGLEVDYVPGREEEIRDIILQNEYDYIIGSVHYIDGWGFDHPDFKAGFDDREIDDIYSQYANILMKMVQSTCFDVVGHIDLVKIWGHRPKRRTSLYYLEPVLKAIKKYGLAVEINSAGLRKTVEEIYPASNLINMMFAYNIPITFGSDAHHPDQIGEGLVEAYRSARQAGYKYLVRLSQREKLVTPMDY
jgi:histidinol-phosphatase (PHP family)